MVPELWHGVGKLAFLVRKSSMSFEGKIPS